VPPAEAIASTSRNRHFRTHIILCVCIFAPDVPHVAGFALSVT
jgi:hypothetical protein